MKRNAVELEGGVISSRTRMRVIGVGDDTHVEQAFSFAGAKGITVQAAEVDPFGFPRVKGQAGAQGNLHQAPLGRAFRSGGGDPGKLEAAPGEDAGHANDDIDCRGNVGPWVDLAQRVLVHAPTPAQGADPGEIDRGVGEALAVVDSGRRGFAAVPGVVNGLEEAQRAVGGYRVDAPGVTGLGGEGGYPIEPAGTEVLPPGDKSRHERAWGNAADWRRGGGGS